MDSDASSTSSSSKLSSIATWLSASHMRCLIDLAGDLQIIRPTLMCLDQYWNMLPRLLLMDVTLCSFVHIPYALMASKLNRSRWPSRNSFVKPTHQLTKLIGTQADRCWVRLERNERFRHFRRVLSVALPPGGRTGRPAGSNGPKVSD